jgi:hypothetical protein
MLRAVAEADERDVGSLASGHGSHVLDLDLARDHLVAQRGHDRGDDGQAILALVRDEDPQMLGVAVVHEPSSDFHRRTSTAGVGVYDGRPLRLRPRRAVFFRLQHSAGVGVST